MAEKDISDQVNKERAEVDESQPSAAAPPRSPLYKPEIYLKISTSAPWYSLSSKTGIKFKLYAILQNSSPSITIRSYDTMFHKLLLAPYPDAGYFDFINIETGKRLRRTHHTDYMLIHDPKLEELSWAQADRYTTLSPDVPYIVEHGFSPRSDDLDGLRVGERYRIELKEEDVTARIRWWSIGAKMQVLHWFFWPLQKPVHTWDRRPEESVRVLPTESCEIEIVD